MSTHIGIYVAGSHAGYGHVSRMATLAAALVKHQAIDQLTFLCTDVTLVERVAMDNGVPPSAYTVVQTSGLTSLVTQMQIAEMQLVLFDHPSLQYWTADQWQVLRQNCPATRFIHVDTPGSTELTPEHVDALLIPHAHTVSDRLTALQNIFGAANVLAGWQALLLRPEFLPENNPQKHRLKPSMLYGPEMHITFTAGGVDTDLLPALYAGTTACDALCSPRIYRTFCLGREASWPKITPPASPWATITGWHPRFFRHGRSDLVVAPLGQTVYEALGCGVPVFVLARTLSDVDCCQALQVASQNAVQYVGATDPLHSERLYQHLMTLLDSVDRQWDVKTAVKHIQRHMGSPGAVASWVMQQLPDA